MTATHQERDGPSPRQEELDEVFEPPLGDHQMSNDLKREQQYTTRLPRTTLPTRRRSTTSSARSSTTGAGATPSAPGPQKTPATSPSTGRTPGDVRQARSTMSGSSRRMSRSRTRSPAPRCATRPSPRRGATRSGCSSPFARVGNGASPRLARQRPDSSHESRVRGVPDLDAFGSAVRSVPAEQVEGGTSKPVPERRSL